MDERGGVTDGARTRDNRNHNPGLYRLSYGHHAVEAADWFINQGSGDFQVNFRGDASVLAG